MCRMFCNFATKLVSIEKMKNEESQMIEGDGLIPFFDVTEDKMQHIIKVIGVGGGGCNNRWERDIRPANTGGGGKGASKMLIDMFPMADGKLPAGLNTYTKLETSQYAYESDYPFMNRDPRFYRTFTFPGFRWAYNGDPTQRDGHNPSYDAGKNYVLWNYVWYTGRRIHCQQ